jgi:hypothetical protein
VLNGGQACVCDLDGLRYAASAALDARIVSATGGGAVRQWIENGDLSTGDAIASRPRRASERGTSFEVGFM